MDRTVCIAMVCMREVHLLISIMNSRHLAYVWLTINEVWLLIYGELVLDMLSGWMGVLTPKLFVLLLLSLLRSLDTHS